MSYPGPPSPGSSAMGPGIVSEIRRANRAGGGAEWKQGWRGSQVNNPASDAESACWLILGAWQGAECSAHGTVGPSGGSGRMMPPPSPFGRPGQGSSCSGTLAAPLWALSEGRGRLRGRPAAPPSPSLSRLSSTQAGSGPGGARGSICHRSLAVWPGAPGEGAQSEARAGVRGLRCPSCGLGPSSATLSSPSGPGKVPGIQPPPPSPALGRPGPHDALAASPQWSPEPVLNLNDSCPQPSQLQLISEGFQGPG